MNRNDAIMQYLAARHGISVNCITIEMVYHHKDTTLDLQRIAVIFLEKRNNFTDLKVDTIKTSQLLSF